MFIVLDQSTVNIIDDIDCYLNKLGISYEIHKTQSSYIIYIKDNLPKQNIDYLKNKFKGENNIFGFWNISKQKTKG